MEDIEKRAIAYFDNNKPEAISEYRIIQLMKDFATKERNSVLREASKKAVVQLSDYWVSSASITETILSLQIKDTDNSQPPTDN